MTINQNQGQPPLPQQAREHAQHIETLADSLLYNIWAGNYHEALPKWWKSIHCSRSCAL